MKSALKFLLLTTFSIFLSTPIISCSGNTTSEDTSSVTSNEDGGTEYTSENENSDEMDGDAEGISDEMDDDAEGIADGTHSATVEYYNPNTGHSATYSLDVEVEDNEVTQIDFPNGGYLDEDHITPEELDENGSATVSGEDGKTYDVQIED